MRDAQREGGQIISLMGHIPKTNGRYNKEVTVQPLKMDNRPTRRPTLERLVRLMEQETLTAVVADRYTFDEAAQAHQDLLVGGYVGKLVVTL